MYRIARGGVYKIDKWGNKRRLLSLCLDDAQNRKLAVLQLPIVYVNAS